MSPSYRGEPGHYQLADGSMQRETKQSMSMSHENTRLVFFCATEHIVTFQADIAFCIATSSRGVYSRQVRMS
jgi:hypothetical protein